ncbi:MAG: ATP-binding protein [Polyangiaceae bacterium]
MPIAVRLLLAFGLVAIFATAAVGLSVRDASRGAMEAEFEARITAASNGLRLELAHETAVLKGLLDPLCDHDTILDHTLAELERVRGDTGAMSDERTRTARLVVPSYAASLQLDDLFLLVSDGTILGASDNQQAKVRTRDSRLAALIKQKGGGPSLRPGDGEPTMEVHCSKSSGGVTVGLVGSRRIAPVLERIAIAHGVGLRVLSPGAAPADAGDVVLRVIDVAEMPGLRAVASVPRKPLLDALAQLDRRVQVAGALALLIALLSAAIMARSLSRPIVALARETREVVTGQPRTVKARGGKELLELADAFNRTIDELTAMKKRLAATERIAAQREVARQIAHEIKNPLAPIRAAVETLRRLRARGDPAFDEYFDEATTTVLEEVHRIANIVTEFTRFARLPAPNPEPIDLTTVVRNVVNLHGMVPERTGDTSPKPRVELVAEPLPRVVADKDQVVQVLTNLIQNGLDAAAEIRPDPRVTVTLGPAPGEHVRIVVRDNGPGVSEAFVPRLFVPYATTKEKGTGLGLAIVQRIVLEHGGEISYRTATKGGAVFQILLPVAGPPELARPMVSTEATGPRG